MDRIRVRRGLLAQDVRRPIVVLRVVGAPHTTPRREAPVPETTASLGRNPAHANTASSFGSASTTGPIGAGTTSRGATYPTTTCAVERSHPRQALGKRWTLEHLLTRFGRKYRK